MRLIVSNKSKSTVDDAGLVSRMGIGEKHSEAVVAEVETRDQPSDMRHCKIQQQRRGVLDGNVVRRHRNSSPRIGFELQQWRSRKSCRVPTTAKTGAFHAAIAANDTLSQSPAIPVLDHLGYRCLLTRLVPLVPTVPPPKSLHAVMVSG